MENTEIAEKAEKGVKREISGSEQKRLEKAEITENNNINGWKRGKHWHYNGVWTINRNNNGEHITEMCLNNYNKETRFKWGVTFKH